MFSRVLYLLQNVQNCRLGVRKSYRTRRTVGYTKIRTLQNITFKNVIHFFSVRNYNTGEILGISVNTPCLRHRSSLIRCETFPRRILGPRMDRIHGSRLAPWLSFCLVNIATPPLAKYSYIIRSWSILSTIMDQRFITCWAGGVLIILNHSHIIKHMLGGGREGKRGPSCSS